MIDLMLDFLELLRENILNFIYGSPRQWRKIYENKVEGGISYAYFLKRPRGSRVCGREMGFKFDKPITLQPGESLTLAIPIIAERKSDAQSENNK